MDFVIEKSKWRRGGPNRPDQKGSTCLLNSHGNMCCLGFVCNQLGIPDSDIIGTGNPVNIRGDKSRAGFLLIEYCGELCQSNFTGNAIVLNDNPDISDIARQEQLIELFKKHGHTLTFVE